jgi:hypothetical protein
MDDITLVVMADVVQKIMLDAKDGRNYKLC